MVHNKKVTGNRFYEWNVWYFTTLSIKSGIVIDEKFSKSWSLLKFVYFFDINTVNEDSLLCFLFINIHNKNLVNLFI